MHDIKSKTGQYCRLKLDQMLPFRLGHMSTQMQSIATVSLNIFSLFAD